MDEDAALREVVKKALEGKGVLAQIRASLRAAVFTVVDEHERASGVYVPNPAALGVKHDVVEGRLSLQLVADFLEHWELHQTLSILKLETDMGAEVLVPREELRSMVGNTSSHAAAAAAAADASNGETKISETESGPPVILQLLAGYRAAPRGEINGISPPAAQSSCGGGDLLTRPVEAHTEGEETGEEEEKEEEADGEDEEEEGRGQREREHAVGASGGVPSRVTLRKRRGQFGGQHAFDSSGSGGEADNEPAAAKPSPEVPGAPTPTARAAPAEGGAGEGEGEDEGEGDFVTAPPSSQIGDDLDHHRDEGGGGYHYNGAMDESSFHFSEDAAAAAAAAAVSVDEGTAAAAAVVDIPMAGAAVAAVAGVTTGSEVGEGDGGVHSDQGYEDYGDRAYRCREVDVGRFARHGDNGSDADDNDAGNKKSLDNDDVDGGANGCGDGRGWGSGTVQREVEGEGSEDGTEMAADKQRSWDNDGDDDGDGNYGDDDFDDDDDDDGDERGAATLSSSNGEAMVLEEEEDIEEALLRSEEGGGAGADADENAAGLDAGEEDAERIADDVEWESRLGLSADSSVAIDEVMGGEGGYLDCREYEIEDAQSV
ncbi:unnamed protein product [Pylaiella littoralis]